MKRCLLALPVLFCALCVTASAQEEQLALYFRIDGSAELRNFSSVPVSFFGYSIQCDRENCLKVGPRVPSPDDPTSEIPDYSAGYAKFYGIEALRLGDVSALVNLLGNGSRGFVTANPSPNNITEISLNEAVLRPQGVIPLGDILDMPPLELRMLVCESGDFRFSVGGAEGIINCIPEPGSLSMAGMCAAGWLLAKRRRR